MQLMVESCLVCQSPLHSFIETPLSKTLISASFLSFVVQVESRDTLNSIALNFDTTPNKLVQLNKLFSRAVVPGQVGAAVHAATFREQLHTDAKELLDTLN